MPAMVPGGRADFGGIGEPLDSSRRTSSKCCRRTSDLLVGQPAPCPEAIHLVPRIRRKSRRLFADPSKRMQRHRTIPLLKSPRPTRRVQCVRESRQPIHSNTTAWAQDRLVPRLRRHLHPQLLVTAPEHHPPHLHRRLRVMLLERPHRHHHTSRTALPSLPTLQNPPTVRVRRELIHPLHRRLRIAMHCLGMVPMHLTMIGSTVTSRDRTQTCPTITNPPDIVLRECRRLARHPLVEVKE